jgi:hypothetical protein
MDQPTWHRETVITLSTTAPPGSTTCAVRRCLPTSLHDVATQNNVVVVLTAVTTSNATSLPCSKQHSKTEPTVYRSKRAKGLASHATSNGAARTISATRRRVTALHALTLPQAVRRANIQLRFTLVCFETKYTN